MIIKTNSTSNINLALERLKQRLDGQLLSYLYSCVRCGLCGESCHYYLATRDPRCLPANQVAQIARIYRRYFTWVGRLLPGWVGAHDLDEPAIAEMVDVVFGGCTLCGRCTVHCSVGLDIPLLVRTARSLLVELKKISPGLQSSVDAAMRTGNNMAIPREDLVDTLLWLAQDLQMEVADEAATIPLDKEGAAMLYTINPREAKFFPLSISAIAKIFYAAELDWTISTRTYDVTNYAYFSGDDEAARKLVQRLYDETLALGAQTLVMAECGHGFRAMRWEGPNWLKRPYPFEVKSIIEILADLVRDGRIALDPSVNSEPVTLHDPCNLVRCGGIIEEHRFVIRQAVSQFIEMTPNRANNYCCGGGGGQLAMGEYRLRRIEAGRIKAEQIRATNAKIVVTPCHNCIDQIMELNQQYQLGVKVKTFAEIVADALVLKATKHHRPIDRQQ